MTQARRYFVSGRVQGVWFRESTRRKAAALALRGYAENLPDGRVEVLACGSAEALDKLGRWLHRGPPLARVNGVESQVAEPDCDGDFRVK